MEPVESTEREAVSPLELLFDLVFVFAVSQLSGHLLADVTWRGAAETAVMLAAVVGVWAYTSFGATLLHVSRLRTQWMLLVVMAVGLFMNAAISDAFDGGSWAFLVPFLVIKLGRPVFMIATTSTRMMREHYLITLAWVVGSAPLWIIGAAVATDTRLVWWALAATIDLVGTWLAHPLPGRVLRSQHVEFDADHMLERCRLFLIVALGETVLSTGNAIASAPPSAMTVLTGTCALAVVVALWALYFVGSDQVVNRHIATTTDPLLAARLATNGEVVVVAGLIAVAVGSELVIAHPHGTTTISLSLLLFGGPSLYLLVQIWYLRVATHAVSPRRLGGLAALVAGAGISLLLPPFAAIALVAAALVALVIVVLQHNRIWMQRSEGEHPAR